MKALDFRNLQDKKIGSEIAKYLQQRLNLISNISEKIRSIYINEQLKLQELLEVLLKNL